MITEKVLRTFVTNMLAEGKLEDILAKTNPDFHENIKKLSESDPSKKNKYLMWSVRELTEKNEDVDEIIQLVSAFHKNMQRLAKKDIHQYRSVNELREEIEKLGEKSKRQEKMASRGNVVYEDDRFKAFRVLSKQDAINLGTGTTWCIAAKVSHNYFDSYSSRNVHFYIVEQKGLTREESPFYKFTVPIYTDGSIYSEEVRDAEQKSGGRLKDVIKIMGDAWEPFLAAIKADAKSLGPTPQYLAAEEKQREAADVNRLKDTEDQGMISTYIEKYVKNTSRQDILKAISKNPNLSANDFNKIIKAGGEDAINEMIASPSVTPDFAQKILSSESWKKFGKGWETANLTTFYQNYMQKATESEKHDLYNKIASQKDLPIDGWIKLLETAASREDLKVLVKYASANDLRGFHLRSKINSIMKM